MLPSYYATFSASYAPDYSYWIPTVQWSFLQSGCPLPADTECLWSAGSPALQPWSYLMCIFSCIAMKIFSQNRWNNLVKRLYSTFSCGVNSGNILYIVVNLEYWIFAMYKYHKTAWLCGGLFIKMIRLKINWESCIINYKFPMYQREISGFFEGFFAECCA